MVVVMVIDGDGDGDGGGAWIKLLVGTFFLFNIQSRINTENKDDEAEER